MRKSSIFALVLAGAFLFAMPGYAQFTTVTATVQDPNGIPYAGGLMTAILVPASSGGYTLGGNPYSGQVGPVQLDSTGTFTINFGDVTQITPASAQWRITINSGAATLQAPLGTGPQSFSYTSKGTTISGSSVVNLTAALTPTVPRLTNFAVAPLIAGQGNYFFDLFNRTGGTLGANYTNYLNGFQPNSGAAAGTSGGFLNMAAYTAISAYPTENVTAVVSGSGISGGYVGIDARIGGTAGSSINSYECRENQTTVFLAKLTSFTPSNTGSNVVLLQQNETTTTADVLNMKIVGNTILCTWNRTALTLEYNDSSSPLATGFPGMDMNGSGLGATISSFTIRNPAVLPTATVNVVVDGDSTTEGASIFSPWTDYLYFPSGKIVSVVNVAVDGKGLGVGLAAGGVNGGGSAGTIETMLVTGTSVVDTLFVPGIVNICVLGPTVNDIANGTSAATEYGYLTTYVANRHAAGWKVVVTPALSNSSHDPVMQQYNQLITANTAGADAIVSLPQSMIGTHAYSNTTFFTDGVHPTQSAAITVMAPAESAAINSLL